ncbi:MAG: hypothetical protein GAK45_02323 [Pseudomonas citronellolis]|nr:MAG: hypothetical protein GAK45_02323 [Pseudomonas citronellolis]
MHTLLSCVTRPRDPLFSPNDSRLPLAIAR